MALGVSSHLCHRTLAMYRQNLSVHPLHSRMGPQRYLYQFCSTRHHFGLAVIGCLANCKLHVNPYARRANHFKNWICASIGLDDHQAMDLAFQPTTQAQIQSWYGYRN